MDTTVPVFDKYLLTGRIFKPGVDVKRWQSSMESRRDLDAGRRIEAERRIQCYEDDTFAGVRRKLAAQFEIENQQELFKTLDISNNLCKRIISAISTIYDDPPRWELKGKDDGGAWDELREASQLDLVQPIVNARVNLGNECFVRVACHKAKLDYQVITPDKLMAESHPKHQERLAAIWIWVGDDSDQTAVAPDQRKGFWHYWGSHDSASMGIGHHVLNEKFEVVDKAFGVDGLNPYVDQDGDPVIPGVMYHRAMPVGKIWDESNGRDIVDGTEMLMALESIINHLLRVDAASIKYLVGQPDEEATNNQTAGALRLLIFRAMAGETVAAGQFRSQADWKGLISVLSNKKQNLANNYGISLDAIELTGNPSSGFALKVRQERLLELRKRQVPLYRRFDLDLYAASAAVWNVERKRASSPGEAGAPADGKPMLWPRDAKPEVYHSELLVPLTAAEAQAELETKQVEMSMGLISVVDLMLKRNPKMTRKQAEQAIKDNIELNKKYAPGNELVVGRAQVLPVDGGGQVTGSPASMSPTVPMAGAGPTSQPAKPTK